MEEIWYKDIIGFITPANFTMFFPSRSMTNAEQMNALMRLSLYFAIVMFIIRKDTNIFFVPIFIGMFTFLIYSNEEKTKKQEMMLLEKMGLMEDKRSSKNLCTKPTENNPFMNILVSDFSGNTKRPKACRLEGKTKHDVKRKFDRNLYRDVDDIFHKKASDRQFYTTPSTTIPNDATSYAKWLYKMPSTCKEGNGTSCYRYQPHGL